MFIAVFILLVLEIQRSFMQKIRQYNNQLNSILQKIEDAFCKLGRKVL